MALGVTIKMHMANSMLSSIVNEVLYDVLHDAKLFRSFYAKFSLTNSVHFVFY